jgi:hypothetical protein
MLKSFNEDFDLQVRSMMDQAQEPAPAGAWEAISSRLDALAAAGLQSAASEVPAAAAARPVRRVWYWAGAALAMAAAIALGIFFTGTSDKNSDLINITSGEGLVAQEVAPAAEPARDASPVAEAPASPVAQPETTVEVAPAAQATTASIATAQKSAPSGRIEADVTTAPVDQTVRSEKQPVSGTNDAPVQSPVQPSAPTASQAADPFAQMAFEDSRKAYRRAPVSLTISGGSTSNNSGASKPVFGGPGAYLQDGIVETSQSSFGIPVIVGLGVKFPVNGILSVGTGLDYSILTRTFEGRYTEGSSVKNGDFNHTLQYIGIPVDLSLKLLTKDDITLYSTVGAEAEYAIYNKYRLLGTDTVIGEKVDGLQWSVGGGLGLEFNVSGHFGIFAEPSVKYYFDCNQPKSIRTDKPFQMVLRLGVRFELY